MLTRSARIGSWISGPALASVTALALIGAGMSVTPWGRAQLALALTRQPEPLLELFFPHPGKTGCAAVDFSLRATDSPPKPRTVRFTVRGITEGMEPAIMLHTGTVQVRGEQVHTVTIPIPDRQLSRIRVNVLGTEQFIQRSCSQSATEAR